MASGDTVSGASTSTKFGMMSSALDSRQIAARISQEQKNRIKLCTRASSDLFARFLRPHLPAALPYLQTKFPTSLEAQDRDLRTTFKEERSPNRVGKGSIGVEIVKGLLSGRAHVTFGSGGSALTVVPFNQGSKQDVEALVDYIFANLGLDLDYIIPSLAVEDFSGDAVPTVEFRKLGEYLCLAGTVIGWTRGTGLMGPTNIVAHELESYGVEPIWADLNGGMDKLPDLADITGRIRSDLMKKSELCRAITLDNSAGSKIINGVEAERLLQTVNVTPRANFRFEFPTLETYESLSDLSSLQGMVDLEKSEAHKFKLQHGDKCDVWAGEGGQWFFKLKKGALVTNPTGWHAGRYGIPDDIIAQTDQATLWALVCTAEAPNMSGITDPYELATALESLEIACDTILSGKPKVWAANQRKCLVLPQQLAPAQGTGVHIVMRAKTVLDLGCPICGILAFTSTSTDKAGCSIPAPGLGPLTIAKQVSPKNPLPILDMAYRSRQLAFRRTQISQWLAHEHSQLQEEIQLQKTQRAPIDDERTDPRIAPIRRALAVWGLTAGDVGVLSIHSTSTKANEDNEIRL
ncbi:hypothetical protein B0H12DRAFT_1241728 [Mycena haematopus]|nr:hypothetical protein B0H12DRAFT_1241728 [Mycena haematopus]